MKIRVSFLLPALLFATSLHAVTGTATIVDTPEPAAFLLVASGLLLLGALRKRAARV